MTLSRVERSQDHRLSLSVLEYAILIGVEHGVDKGIALILLVASNRVPIIAARISIGVLTLDVVFLGLSEQLNAILGISHPGMRQNLSSCQTLDWVLLEQA